MYEVYIIQKFSNWYDKTCLVFTLTIDTVSTYL